MSGDCKVPRRRVFSLFYFFDTKTQKITKNARVALRYQVFFMNKKKLTFLRKKSATKSLFIYSKPESSRAIFKSKKTRKNVKNMFPVYGWASKSIKNHAFFIKNNHILLLENSLLLSFPGIQMEHKNHSFLTSKFMYFYVKKLLFSSFYVCRCR